MIRFEAGWGREGIIKIEVGKCHSCGEIKICLCIDSSIDGDGDGLSEYGAGKICRTCTDRLFETDKPIIKIKKKYNKPIRTSYRCRTCGGNIVQYSERNLSCLKCGVWYTIEELKE